MALTITIPGAVEATIGATAPAVLTIGVGTPGATGPAGAAGSPGVGVPVGGTAGQFLTKIDGTNYNTDWTTVNLSVYAVKANNLSDLASASTARTNLGLGSLAVVNDAPSNGSQYARKNAAWEVVTTTPDFITSVTSPLAVTSGVLTVDLSDYLPVSGGTLDANSTIDASTATQAAVFSGTGLNAQLTANPSENVTVNYSGLQVQNFTGTMSVGPAGLTFPNSSVQTVAFPGFTGYAPLASPALTGNPTAPTPATSDNDTSIATTAYVKAQPFGDRYLTSSTTSNTISNGNKTFTIDTGLSYTPTQSITISYDASNHMHGEVLTYNSGTGVLTVDINHHTGSGTYTAWVVNVGGVVPVTSVAWGGITGTLSTQTDLQSALDLKANLASPALTGSVTITSNSTGAALFIEQAGTGNILTLHDQATDTNFVAIDANGKVSTIPSEATNGAGLNIAHGVAPTTPVNGDIWTTTGGLFMRQNGTTQQYVDFAGTQTINGAKTFSASNQTLGSSTATGTINVATGATISASTKTVNVATGGVVGSTTTTTIGPVLGASTTSIGGTTAASTLNLATGATLTATTKAVNIGTAGVAGSTTNIAIGSTTGTSTTTLQGNVTASGTTLELGNSTAASQINLGIGATISGASKTVSIGNGGASGSTTNVTIANNIGAPSGVVSVIIGTSGGVVSSTTTLNGTTNGVTPAVDTNSVALATTAFVVGQAGSATPLVNGTAAVGTSLRYARQDHVHGTDTTRAPLASPSLTGTPLSTTAAVDTNTTQIATTAYVVGQAASATPLVNGTAAVGTSLRYARADHVHGTDTTRAPLASPTFTGTPSLPTGTTGITQSPGNNTTALATTAFVTAAVPAFATATNVIFNPSSTTLALNPALIPQFLANSNYRNLCNLTSSNISGSANVTQFGSSRELYTTSTTVSGRSNWANTFYSATFIGMSSKSNSNIIDWSKQIWVFGTAILGRSSYLGNANTVTRINLGGRGAAASGDITSRGIGLFKVGGTSTFINLTVHNGTTLTNVASSVTLASDATVHYIIYSDGAGNVQLYLDGTLAASTSAGPTGNGTSGHNVYEEQIESATSAGVLASMHVTGAGIYLSR